MNYTNIWDLINFLRGQMPFVIGVTGLKHNFLEVQMYSAHVLLRTGPKIFIQ